jgi:hypothetical protein
MEVYVVNESTALSDIDAWNIGWACDYQAQFHYGRSGWRSDVRCAFLPGGGQAKIPAGGSVLHFLDTADQAGALGYHDEDGNEVPYARVFVKTTQADGGVVSEVASHELLELASDPHVNLTALTGDMKRLYAVEVGDPVQGNAYDVGAPEAKVTGVAVADFALPNWFDPSTPADQPTSFRGAVKGPFALAAQGYYGYVDLTNVAAGWQQQAGAERHGAPPSDRDDRFGQRVGGKR